MQININDITDLSNVLTVIDKACNEIYSMINDLQNLVNSYNQSNNKLFHNVNAKLNLLTNRYDNLLSIRQELAKDIENKEEIIRKIMIQK